MNIYVTRYFTEAKCDVTAVSYYLNVVNSVNMRSYINTICVFICSNVGKRYDFEHACSFLVPSVQISVYE